MIERLHLKYYFSMIAMVSLLFYNYFTSSDNVSLLVLVVYCIYIFRCKEIYLLPSMVFMSLFGYIFLYNQYNLMIFISLSFILRSLHSFFYSSVRFLSFAVAYIILHLLMTELMSVNIAILSSFFSILCLLIGVRQLSHNNVTLVSNSFLVSFFISSFLGYFKDLTRLDDIMEIDQVEEVLRYSGLMYDANFYTIIALVSMMILIKKMRSGQTSWFNYVMLIVVLILGVQTYSKSFYICAGLLLVYFLLVSSHKMRYLSIFTLFLFIMVPLLIEKITSIFDIMAYRFDQSQDINEMTTGRTDIWLTYNRELWTSTKEILLGHGVVLQGNLMAAHNTIIELLYKFGIVGLLIDIIYVIYNSKEIFRRFGKNRLDTIVFGGVFLLLLFFLSAYTFLALWSCLLMTFVVCSNYQVQNNAVDE